MNKAYYTAMHAIIVAGHRITDEITRALKEDDISEPQYNVLRILRSANGKPVSVGTIQAGMVQRSSNVTRIVDKLMAKKLVVREECSTNRRKKDIAITQKGIDLLARLDEKVHAYHKPYSGKLSAEELNTLEALIKRLRS